MTNTLAMTVVALVAVGTVHAATNYVDCALKDYTDHDGSSWEKAFATIQEGVDAAEEGDVVLVAPGVYDQGGRADTLSDGGATNRVVLDKGLHLKSSDGAASTFIVGARGSGADGLGDDAVRCIVSTQGKAETTIEGFTLTDGATPSGENKAKTCGGAFWAYKNAPTYLVDCIVSNNVATRGGGVWGGTAVRTLFRDNAATVAGVALRCGNAVNCVFAESGTTAARAAVDSVYRAVNCTFVGCPNAIVSESNYDNDFRNCLFVACPSLFNGTKAAKPVFRDCVAEVACASEAGSDSENFKNGAPPQTMNPITGDLRPLAGSACVGAGDADHLGCAFIPERFRTTDFLGGSRLTDDTVSIGAIEAAVTPAGGCCVFNFNAARGGVSIDGVALPVSGLYAHAATWPLQTQLGCVPAAGQTVWGILQSGFWSGYRYPTDNAVWLTFPASGATITNYPYYADKVVWVSPDGNDTYSGDDLGKFDHPYGTLQAAVDAVASVDRGIVYALEGTYDQGERFGNKATNRVYLASQVRLIAAGDREKTFIVGARDAAADSGCGAASVRCAAANTDKYCQIAGFTLTGGFANGDSSYGGGAFMGGERSVVSGCIVSNCVSPRAAAAWGGWLQGCLVTANTTVSGGNSTCRNGQATGCVFRGNTSVNCLLGYGQTCYNCTIISDGRTVNDSGPSLYNCVIRSASKLAAPKDASQFAGLIVSNVATVAATSGFILADQKFVSIGTYDYRLRADSPVFGKGCVDVPNFVAYATTDYEGAPLNFVNGVPTPGAFQRPVAVVWLRAANEGEISPTGQKFLGVGKTLDVTGSATARNFLGLDVDGVFYDANGSRSVTLPYVAVSALGGVNVRAVYATDWYVSPDAAIGDDTNNGWTPAAPKRTLTGVMANVVSGDVVHAAAGVYADGSGISKSHSANSGDKCKAIESRVVVPVGVTLVGAGRDTTVIEGALANDCGNAYGLGTNAVRCAYLEKGATLKGFTLRDGRTAPREGPDWQDDNYMGGGVCGVNSKTSLIEDCLVTNCVSVRGGAGYKVMFRNCVITGNRGTSVGAAVRNGTLVNSLVTGNFGTDPISTWYDLVNVTFASDNEKHIGGPLSIASGGSGIVLNSILFPAKDGQAHTAAFAMTNVALVGGAAMEADAQTCVTSYADAAAAGINADWTLATGSPLVDAGDRTAYAALGGGVTDVDGEQRVSNGAIDLGCREFDWRPRYAKTLGQGFEVTAASEDVTLTSDGVRLVNGSTLAATWTYLHPGKRHRFFANVSGDDGELTLCRNGSSETTMIWTEANSGKPMAWRDDEAKSCDLAFSFGSLTGTGFATLLAVEEAPGLLLIIR